MRPFRKHLQVIVCSIAIEYIHVFLVLRLRKLNERIEFKETKEDHTPERVLTKIPLGLISFTKTPVQVRVWMLNMPNLLQKVSSVV